MRSMPSPLGMTSTMMKTSPSFFIKTQEIPQMQKTYDLSRLMVLPKHKINRSKFDKSKSECLKEKENNPLTM